jgi:hypothetical protein
VWRLVAAAVQNMSLFSNIFIDLAVLDQQHALVWGSAPAGVNVTLDIDGAWVATATADGDGTWRARLPPITGDGSNEHTLTASTPTSMQRLHRILFGRCFVCRCVAVAHGTWLAASRPLDCGSLDPSTAGWPRAVYCLLVGGLLAAGCRLVRR